MKKFHVGIKALVMWDDKILLLHKSGGDFWEVPGGRIDDSETIEETLKREITEELPNASNIRIGKVVDAFRLQKDIEPDTSLVLIYYTAQVDFDGDPQISDEHDDWKWATKDEALVLMPEKENLIEAVFVKS